MDIKAGDVLVEHGREHRRLEVRCFQHPAINDGIMYTRIDTGRVKNRGSWFAICSVKLKGRKKAHDITRIRVSRIPKDYRIERK